MRFDNENPASVSTATGGEVFGGISFDDATNLLILNVGWGTGKGCPIIVGRYENGRVDKRTIALCDGHAAWLEWCGP